VSRRWAAYAAYANAVMALVQLMTSGGDPKANGVVGLVNNAAGVLWALSFVPLAFVFYRSSRTHATVVSVAVFAFGLVAFAGSAFLEISTATGRLILGCHIPGHWAKGMRAAVRIALPGR